MKIKFTKSFSSTTFGNVWQGREVIVTNKQALRFIGSGLAEQVKPEDGKRRIIGRGKAPSAAD